MKIKADRDKCVGAAQCVRLAPAYFDQDEDEGLVIVRNPNPADADHADVEGAVFACPARALMLED